MYRRLIGFALAIVVVPDSVSRASPTTRPAPEATMPSIRDFDHLYLFSLPPGQGLPQWKGLPDSSKGLSPVVVNPRFELRPHGRSFQFNGVTVYIEPV
jgi:hypothetical protein